MDANAHRSKKTFLGLLATLIWTVSMIFGWQGPGIKHAHAQTDASVRLLTSSFYEKQPMHQKQLLRQLTLFSSSDVLVFFCQVALDQRVSNDVRRDALKSILAMDSTTYRAALMPLASAGLTNQAVVDALTLLPIEGIGHAWLISIDWASDTESIITQKLTQAYRSLKVVDAIDARDVAAWDKPAANAFLKKEINRSMVDQESFWLMLLALVSDSNDAKYFRGKLSHPLLEIRQAAVYGLTRPGGPRSYKSIVTALKKESKSRLPVTMIGYLVEDGSQNAKNAGEFFAKSLPAKEKAWVRAQWR